MPVRARSTLLRFAGIATVATGAAFISSGVARAARGLPTAVGAPRRRTRPAPGRTAHFDGTQFRNTLPSSVLEGPGMVRIAAAMATRGDQGRPTGPVPLGTPELTGPAADLAATWLGHATVLLEIDGLRVLTDPVFGERVSPSHRLGPARLHPAPTTIAALPPLGAIVISHDHYDHLEVDSIRELAVRQRCPFLVPIGVGAHLRRWGVPDDRIIELDWDETVTVAGLTITCTEARHFSGRLFARNTTLWASWAIAGPSHRVFFGGDTGYTPAFAGIGARYGPFDLTVLPIGAYNEHWADIHMNPEEAVRAHGDLGGAVLLPIHWATFDLAFHAWAEPVERLREAAKVSRARLALPRPGQRLTAGAGLPTTNWWSAPTRPGSGPAEPGSQSAVTDPGAA
jgi:L-ascorbate metabolism protein UlaG (beta-lactamase superfamily)